MSIAAGPLAAILLGSAGIGAGGQVGTAALSGQGSSGGSTGGGGLGNKWNLLLAIINGIVTQQAQTEARAANERRAQQVVGGLGELRNRVLGAGQKEMETILPAIVARAKGLRSQYGADTNRIMYGAPAPTTDPLAATIAELARAYPMTAGAATAPELRAVTAPQPIVQVSPQATSATNNLRWWYGPNSLVGRLTGTTEEEWQRQYGA